LQIFLCRKYEGRISGVAAFCLLLGQKFMSIVIGKVSLYGELPTLKDSYFLVLLGIHFLTFTLFHTHTGDDIMQKIKKSEVRIVVQETFKGYGKGLSLISLVNKGMKLSINPTLFIIILLFRGSASAMFKSTCMSFLLKKPIKTKKAKVNFLFITIPTVLFFLGKLALISFEIHAEKFIIKFFILFMVVSRCMRALAKILKAMRGEKTKNRRKHKLDKLAPIHLTKTESEQVSARLLQALNPEVTG